MNGVDAFELHKNNPWTNAQSWLHETPIVSYGVVTKVHSATLVDVEASVQRSSAEKEAFTVRLLSMASILKEDYVNPVPGDQVLLLFVQRYHPAMFNLPAEMRAFSGAQTVYAPGAEGYTRYAGVGILMSVFHDYAVTQIKHSVSEGGVPEIAARTAARLQAYFGRAVDLIFDKDAGVSDEALVSVLFGKDSPCTVRHLAPVLREHGFLKQGDGSLESLDAPVEERYSVSAPITKSIQGAQTVTIGVGEDKDGQPEDTTAPVNITMGADAEITVASKSGVSVEFDKAVALTTKEELTLTMQGAFNLTVDSSEKIHIGNQGKDMKALLTALVAEIKGLKTFGSPGAHTVDPSSITALDLFTQQNIDVLFE
jgi:hypothetical protein